MPIIPAALDLLTAIISQQLSSARGKGKKDKEEKPQKSKQGQNTSAGPSSPMPQPQSTSRPITTYQGVMGNYNPQLIAPTNMMPSSPASMASSPMPSGVGTGSPPPNLGEQLMGAPPPPSPVTGNLPSKGAVQDTLEAMWPTISQKITSRFGPRTAPTAGASTNHGGIDIGGALGDPIKAAFAGTVKSLGQEKGYGNVARILGKDGLEQLYAHAQDFGIKPGQVINAGDLIGHVGQTGVATGPHLHFGLYQNGAPIDPLTRLRGLLK